MQRRPRHAVPPALLTVVALLAVVAVVAGCGGPRIDAPSARQVGPTPDVVATPDDPADDPQLAALDLPEDRPEASDGGLGVADGVRQLERLPALAQGLRAELGDDVEVCAVEVACGATSAQVPVDERWDEWRLGIDDDRLIRVPQQVPLECPANFRLDGADLGAPARLATGVDRQLPGARLGRVRLSRQPEGWGLAWHLEVSRGGQSATVVADPSGAVLAVTP